MRQIFKLLTLCFPLLLIGCSGDESTTNNAVPDNYFNRNATLQGTVFDAVTGSRIIDTSLKVTVVQGASNRNATVKTGTNQGFFGGDFALSGIPISINSNTTYRVVVTADGYQELDSILSLNANDGSTDTGVNDTLDTVYNYLRNAYLFPVGATAPGVTVNVTYNGEAVVGATVLLQPATASNSVTADTSSSNRLTPSNGFLGAMSATSDASGQAVFAGTGLVLGGSYSIDVQPVMHEGIQLGMNVAAGTFVIGISSIMQNISLADLVPGTADGLYIVSTSNADSTSITASGVLTITFSRAVTMGTEAAFTATLLNATTAVLNGAGTDTSVTATLSADGLVLTLTPVFSTNPAPATDSGLQVNFGSGGVVRLVNTNDTAPSYGVFTTLVSSSGNTLNGDGLDIVNVTQSF